MMNIEEFRLIPGYSSRYEVSIRGIVRRISFTDRRGAQHNIRELKHGKCAGYPAVWIAVDQNKTCIYVHRAIALAFIPNPFGYREINHKDGNKTNFDIENLEWVTHKQNVLHACMTGLKKDNKLSVSNVVEIRLISKAGVPTPEIAKRFGVTPEQIRNVVYRNHWKWVE